MTHPVDDNSQSREARQQALSQLAAQHQGGQATSSTENYRERVIAAPRRRQLWQRPQLWLALLVVLSVIGGAFWRLHASTTAVAKQQIRTIALVPASGEMDCPHDMAGSPDGATLAVLGYQADCSLRRQH